MGSLGGQLLLWVRLDAALPSQCSPAHCALGNGPTGMAPLPPVTSLTAPTSRREPHPTQPRLISCSRNEQALGQYLVPRVPTAPCPSLFPQAVKRFLKLECKCHGVSGSCTLRTCWLAMSDFRKTGDYLRKKYNGAIQVTMNQDGTGFTVANKNFRKPTKTDLVYFENSPDYCVMDKSAGKTQSSSHYPKASLPPFPTGQQLPASPAWGSAPRLSPSFWKGGYPDPKCPQHPTPAQAGLHLSKIPRLYTKAPNPSGLWSSLKWMC